MTKPTQAEMEARYDAERNGTLYIKPADDQITADEQRALDILLKADEHAVAGWIDSQADDMASILEEIDGGEAAAYARFTRAVDGLATLPDALRERAVVMLEEFLSCDPLGTRFDFVVDVLAVQPDERLAAGLSMIEDFLDGVALCRDEQATPARIVTILEAVEQHFDAKRASA